MVFGNYSNTVYIVLPAIFILSSYLGYIIWKRKLIIKIFNKEELYRNSVFTRNAFVIIKELLIIICITLFGFTALQPQWGEGSRIIEEEGADILIALDVSRSMLARDVKPNRLERARNAIRIIISSLDGDRVSLLLFAGDAFISCPFTGDIGAFLMFLDAAEPDAIGMQGTDFGGAFDVAIKAFEKRRFTSRILLIFTDGENHKKESYKEIKKLRNMDVQIYAIGIGTSNGAAVPVTYSENVVPEYFKDEEGNIVISRKNRGVLKKIASLSNGKVFDVSKSMADSFGILKVLKNMDKNTYGKKLQKEKKEQYQIFAFILLAFLLMEFLLPERRKII